MKRLILFLLLVLSIFSPAKALEEEKVKGDPVYVGIDECKNCHEGPEKGEVYEKWYKTSHRRGYEHLVIKEKQTDPKCLDCHVTGYDKGGYKMGEAGAVKFEGVQCESCHGPGSRHIEIVTNREKPTDYGISFPTADTCNRCHAPMTFGFDFKTYSKRISHKYRNK